MPPAVTDVFDIAAEFLAAAVAALDLTQEGAPERAFVSPGNPALDCCDQLTVHTTLLNEADFQTGPGTRAKAKAINRGGLALTTVAIQISRCVTGMKVVGDKVVLPDPAVQQAEAEIIDSDGWALWLGLNYALKHGDLSQLCEGAERLGMVKVGPEGGCAGWVATYRYPIQGGILGT